MSTETNNKITKVDTVCEHCNTVFRAYSKENRKFCSKECWQESKKGKPFVKKTGSNVDCKNCGESVYKPLSQIKRSKNHFCSKDCANKFQSKNKVSFTCKICNNNFTKSKSEVVKSENRNHKILYCSIDCRNEDKKRMSQKSYQANQSRLEKYGLNKFEQDGREWLLSLGFILDVDFKEQVLLLEQASVDIYFPKQKVVIQFDGDYWHSNPERAKIDKIQNKLLLSNGFKLLRISDKVVEKKGFEFFNKDIKNLMNES